MPAVDDFSEARALGRRLHWRRVLGGLTAAFIVTAGLAWGVLSLTWPEAPVHIHVRWRPDVTDAQRVELERHFDLIHGVRTEGMSWEYQLVDASTANIRQLIQDARVDDTAHLNRIRYRPEFAQDRSRQIVAYSLAIGAIGLAVGAVGSVVLLVVAGGMRRAGFRVPSRAVGLAGVVVAVARIRIVIAELLSAWRAAALIAAIAAVCLPIAARAVAGPRGALVDVRWEAWVDTSARERLEARFRLADGESIDGSTWRYDLVDPSRDTLRALVRDPAVGDTHHIDRARFALDDAERTSRRGRIASGDALVSAADGVALALGAYVAWPALVALWRVVAARDVWTVLLGFLVRAENRLWPYALLILLGLGAYAGALWFPLTNGDDLIFLNSVATVENPLSYFIHDSGLDNDLYRPLTSVSIWLTYQAFGVWALPHQIINLLLHIASVFLLYRIVLRAQPDKTIALLFAAVFMVSKYTWLAATYISDRPMVLTGLFLLLLINHLSQRDDPSGNTSATSVRIPAVAAFSVLALMSKESGVVVPAVGLLYALMPGRTAHPTPRHRLSLALVTASIIGLYIVFRILIFGPNFASYTQDGHMFLGAIHYQHSSDLQPLLRYANYAENVIKNALAPVLPVFAEGGALLTRQTFLAYGPVIVSTVLLFGLAVRRDISRLQWIALMIMLANAVAHFALFRFRLQYLSHAAFCLFVASSPLLANSQGHCRKKLVAKTLAVIALAGSIVWTSYMLDVYRLERNRALETLEIDGVRRYGPVVEEVLQQYK